MMKNIKEKLHYIILGSVSLIFAILIAAEAFSHGRVIDVILSLERPDRNGKTYSGEAYDYMFVSGDTGNNMTVNIYTYDDQLCLYVQGTAGENTYSKSEILEGSKWNKLSKLILSADNVVESEQEGDRAWLMKEDGYYVQVEPVSLEEYGITEDLIYKGPFPEKAKLEADKKLFDGIGIEYPLGGQCYGTPGTEDVIYKLPESDYTMVADQIRKAVKSDSFTVISMESEGYRKGMRLKVQSSDGKEHILFFTGHGLLTGIGREAAPGETLH